MDIKILAIRTDFKHHGEDFGYKQILKFIKPYKTLGINERDVNESVSTIKMKYQWLFEFDAFKYRNEIDLVHILYGEDYLRWSNKLFKKTPVVATFHQPAEILEREVIYGDYRGRVGKLTHSFTKDRFKNLAAAIVTNTSQKEVLKRVMPEDKIHHISLGVHLKELNDMYNEYIAKDNRVLKNTGKIITVGNWMRDWDFYFEVVEKCKGWKFVLVNKNLVQPYIDKIKSLDNLIFHENISDLEMFNLYLESDLQFLPVKGIAGSNAFLQGFALGCPLVLTNVDAEQFKNDGDIISLYEKGNVNDAIKKMEAFISTGSAKIFEYKIKSNIYANQFSWEEIANKTINLYKKII